MPAEPDRLFGPRTSVEEVEEGDLLAPKFDADGLIPVVTTDFDSGELLMHGYMNAEALARTIETGEAHYFSRSRQVLWHKGATSGLVQRVRECLVDDDQGHAGQGEPRLHSDLAQGLQRERAGGGVEQGRFVVSHMIQELLPGG